ncbi:MAG TPA: tRNA preQ1(34) S-adenosylmethionine ribosyltransferase-isomerase QueA [Kiritimatiellia bacterium]|nr:tRNA preQ1(34) S-adenosylmethionine ribosyltransferase-isomerase QueA [Kiritimatiellia bacterium]HMP33946.1 tRNA preQ1(34) S-adenosylmethionine ribosyltransferase-isomerase QueA [Kiritimatiellia bacterium]
MKTTDFDYHLPEHLIAQHPAERRDGARMMVVHRSTGTWEHRLFSDLPAYLRAGDIVVVNNTKVIPARLIGRKPGTGGKTEIFLLEEKGPGLWDVLLRSRRRPKPGEPLSFGDGRLIARMEEEGLLGRALVRFDTDRPVLDWAHELGDTPLPPYIRRTAGSLDADRDRYQTVYARHPGAVAAPTAGLHFTPDMFARLAGMEVSRAEVTLHVGLGTFRPVTADQVDDHRMEEERYVVEEPAAAAIRAAKARDGRVLAVGSTSVRTLESVAARHGDLVADTGRTDLFIRPPYPFRATDLILTNFHLPKSTLLMMMSAFASRDLMLAAYADAVREEYRFFSYGDCMLIV